MTGGLEAASGIAILASLFKAAMIKIVPGKSFSSGTAYVID